jgi:hypothetical protein
MDIGANGFAFIDTNLAALICWRFEIQTISLGIECAVRGYNGQAQQPITHAILLNLIIDGWWQLQILFLIVNLGRHDIILGKMWITKFDVLPDCRRKQLLWPDEQSLEDQITTRIVKMVPIQILKKPQKINEEHQQDTDRRNRIMEESDVIQG